MNEITPNTDFSMSQAKSNNEDVSSTRSFSSRERMTLLPDDFVPLSSVIFQTWVIITYINQNGADTFKSNKD